MKLVLGSASSNRKKIFDIIGLEYEVIKSLVDEESNEKDPIKYTENLSRNKALSVASQLKEKALIICADTIMELDNKFYEKPKSIKEASDNLRQISGKCINVITGITINDLYNNKIISFFDITKMYIRKLNDEEIDWYIKNEKDIFNHCCFVVPGKGNALIEKIDGDYYNALGIPINKLINELYNLGYKLNDLPMKN